MRKKVFGRKFKRDANERKALLKGLMTDLVLKESITTTEEKAKAIKGSVEKLVTKAKVKGDGAVALLSPYLSVAAVEKVLHDLALRFANRPGGYVRIVKLGKRFGDNASMAVIEWVEKTSARAAKAAVKSEEKVEKAVKTAAKKPARSVRSVQAVKKTRSAGSVRTAKKETK